MKDRRVEVIGVSVHKGIVTCLNEQGVLENYAMRGIKGLGGQDRVDAVELGLIDEVAFKLKTFPKNYVFIKEDPVVQAGMKVTFNKKTLYNYRAFRNGIKNRY